MTYSDNQDFIELVRSGDIAAVKAAVASGKVQLREMERNFDAWPSYLIAAVRTHDCAMVKCLLDLGADPEAVSYAREDGVLMTPYRYAQRFFLDEIVELMTPYLGKIPRDEQTEHARWEDHVYFGSTTPDLFDD